MEVGKKQERMGRVGWDWASDPLIAMKGVKKAYRTPAGDFYALAASICKSYSGEFVALLGRSGAGKWTLINMMTGIDRPGGKHPDRRASN